MTLHDYLKFVFSLLFVLGLMGGLALILKRLGIGGASMLPADKRRLKILEILQIDARRKAVLLSRDGIEHLVIVGGNGETVIETHINAKISADGTGQNV